jgi:hypothetical protein
VKALNSRAYAPYDIVPARRLSTAVLVPGQAAAGPAVLVRRPAKILVRWLRQALHTGVYLATFRLPVGIVAWVYERRPRPRRRRLATDRELLMSLLWVGAVIGGLVLVVVITAGEADATPAEMITRASGPLAAEEQSPHVATNATAAPGGTHHTSDDGRPQALTSASGQSRGTASFSAQSARSLYPARTPRSPSKLRRSA